MKPKGSSEDRDASGVLSLSLDRLELSIRTEHRLYKLETIGDVAQLTARDLLRIRGIGPKTLREIEDALARHGLRLGGRPLPTLEDVRRAHEVIVTTSPLNHHPEYAVGVGPNWRVDFEAAARRLYEAAEVLFAHKRGHWPREAPK